MGGRGGREEVRQSQGGRKEQAGGRPGAVGGGELGAPSLRPAGSARGWGAAAHFQVSVEDVGRVDELEPSEELRGGSERTGRGVRRGRWVGDSLRQGVRGGRRGRGGGGGAGLVNEVLAVVVGERLGRPDDLVEIRILRGAQRGPRAEVRGAAGRGRGGEAERGGPAVAERVVAFPPVGLGLMVPAAPGLLGPRRDTLTGCADCRGSEARRDRERAINSYTMYTSVKISRG